MKTLADFKKENPDDPYCEYSKEGKPFLDVENLLASGFCGFCGCGQPDNALLYVLGGLMLISDKSPEDRSLWDEWWIKHQAAEQEFFGNSGAAYFFYYWASEKGFTEHGGSVPGWLTEHGRELLGLLREWNNLKEGNSHDNPTS